MDVDVIRALLFQIRPDLAPPRRGTLLKPATSCTSCGDPSNARLCVACHERLGSQLMRQHSPDAKKRTCKPVLTTEGKEYRYWVQQGPE